MTDSDVPVPADSNGSTGTGATETAFPKVIVADEDPSIVHYSPKAHQPLDPSKRDF